MRLTLVAAVAQNGVIGAKNALPWYIPEDLKHFKQVTIGKTVLMGKNTFDSVMKHLGKPLPDRTNVVVSRQKDIQVPEGVIVYNDLNEALEGLKNIPEVMVAGGGQIFSQLMDKADKLILTEVHKEVEGDVFFPKIEPNVWQKNSEE